VDGVESEELEMQQVMEMQQGGCSSDYCCFTLTSRVVTQAVRDDEA